jgi:hypothetical protein
MRRRISSFSPGASPSYGGTAAVLGVQPPEGIFASFFDREWTRGWILRLVKIGAEAEGQAVNVMEIDRPR